MKIALIGAAMILGILATSRAEAGAILYTTTDIGTNYQILASANGQDYGVTGSNGISYAFDKSPVTSIYERTDSSNQEGSYYVYVMQNGGYKIGYEYDYSSVLGNYFHPTFNTSSAWFTFPAYPPSTIPNPSPISDINSQGQAVGTSMVSNGSNGYNSIAAFSGVNLQLHGTYGSSDNLNDYIVPISGVTLTSAVKIDDLGRIVALGSNGDDYLLTPTALGSPATVPEPPTALMLGVFGSLLGLRSICRKWRQ